MKKVELIKKKTSIFYLEKFSFFFSWLNLFYPQAKGIQKAYSLSVFFPQKILRINGRVKWPVHFTSRVLNVGNIIVGNRSAPGLTPNCYIQGKSGIKIGHNFRMGPGSGLISANHALEDYDVWVKSDPIIIGDNVWLGMNVVVLPGVCIGDNVAIGANSVVSRDIPSNTVAAGNPCKVIREKPPYRGFDYSIL